MSDTRYWFARIHPLEDPRKGLIPIVWEGWAVTILFMAGALFSVASAFMLYEMGQLWWALLTTPLLFIVSAGIYIVAVATKGDLNRTARQYHEARKGNAL